MSNEGVTLNTPFSFFEAYARRIMHYSKIESAILYAFIIENE